MLLAEFFRKNRFKKQKKQVKKTGNYIIDYYNRYNEDDRLDSRHGNIEFLTTVKYIENYLKPNMKIIEIGAGTGKYSHYFAERGYKVDAVELVESNIEKFKTKITPDEDITITQGTALDLCEFKDGSYDITLLLGPMYHLYTVADQLQAISEAIAEKNRTQNA